MGSVLIPEKGNLKDVKKVIARIYKNLISLKIESKSGSYIYALSKKL